MKVVTKDNLIVLYLNKILSNWKDKGIKTLDKAKQMKIEVER